jgi:hypothetical protein
VLLPTVRVSVELAPAEIGLGLKPALVPAGRPVVLRVTLWAEPLVITVEMVLLALLPWEALTLLGLALIEKSEGGAAVTVRLTDVEWVALLPVPVTVTV